MTRSGGSLMRLTTRMTTYSSSTRSRSTRAFARARSWRSSGLTSIWLNDSSPCRGASMARRNRTGFGTCRSSTPCYRCYDNGGSDTPDGSCSRTWRGRCSGRLRASSRRYSTACLPPLNFRRRYETARNDPTCASTTFATHSRAGGVMNGGDLFKLQKILGHHSVQ
jgi:hypothetical protein